MGRMKGTLGDAPPTIVDCRRQGMFTFTVHRPPPCGRVSRLTFDALRLSDKTFFAIFRRDERCAAPNASAPRARSRRAGTRLSLRATASGRWTAGSW